MPSPADSPDPRDHGAEQTVVRGGSPPDSAASTGANRGPTAATPPTPPPAAFDQTAAAGPFVPHTFVPPHQEATFTFRAAGPHGSASGSGPPSGQAIRCLNDWVELNRETIDVGDYKLLRSIGTGAFGAVWEAHNFDTGERVAVKFLSAGDDRWEAMLDEVKFLQAMEGTHGIVTVKQVRKATPTQPPYYVMPLANAASLADQIIADKPRAAPGAPVIPAEEACRLFTRVATALAAVHRRGIHHCDLKPRNVLLHHVNPADPAEPLIADFGQAHLASDDTPALGTFFYMPPDQADAGLKKTRSDSGWDVYALGAVLYEMLVGEPPRKTDGLVKDLRKTEHLETKLTRYRDQIAAAPAPAAHHKLVDPLLADVIDRCLALDRAKRPRDAGEVVDLLKKRAWWRKVRSLLALGTIATVLFVVLMGSISWYVARKVMADTRENVAREIDGSLTRTAWYGKGAVERAFRDHVAFIEQRAADCPADVRAALAAAADAVAAAPPDQKYEAVGDRAVFDAWVGKVRERVENRWPGEPGRAIALVLVAGDAPDGRPASGYTLTRADGTKPPAADRKPTDPNYRRDWAFRDYFNGTGNHYDQEGRPRPVIRCTHLSQTYRSRRDGRWRVEVVTPLWSGPGRGVGRVVALVSVGLDVDANLKTLIDMPDDQLAAGTTGRHEVARAVNAFVVNDRAQWVWHEAGMKALAADTAAGRPPRDPDNLVALARAFGPESDAAADEFVPWDFATGLGEYSDRYVDPVELKVDGTGERKIAHTLVFHPLSGSRYEAPRAQKWGFVVQVNEATALRPLDTVRGDMLRAGLVLVATLAGLAVVLWVWLFRLLRGWEFAGHA
jgi:serine/threonine protein kinase